mgnify:CR=1 FL=1
MVLLRIIDLRLDVAAQPIKIKYHGVKKLADCYALRKAGTNPRPIMIDTSLSSSANKPPKA